MAGYGCVSAYAKLLGEDQAVSLLRKTLEEEKEADKKLTQLSGQINLEAAETDETHGGNGHSKKAAMAKATTVGA